MLGHLFVSGIKGMAESFGIMTSSGVQYLVALQRKYAKK